MLEQFGIQYDLNWLLPARAVDHGEGRLPLHAVLRRRPVRRAGLEDDGAGRATRERYAARAAPCRCCATPTARPLKRNFVHVDDLVVGDPGGDRQPARRSASSSTSAWTEPVDYGEVARLSRADARPAIRSTSQASSIRNWMDNSKAKYRARLAAGIRPRKACRLGLGLRRARQTIRASSGIRVDVVRRSASACRQFIREE